MSAKRTYNIDVSYYLKLADDLSELEPGLPFEWDECPVCGHQQPSSHYMHFFCEECGEEW